MSSGTVCRRDCLSSGTVCRRGPLSRVCLSRGGLSQGPFVSGSFVGVPNKLNINHYIVIYECEMTVVNGHALVPTPQTCEKITN